jgi:hypothetical protein
MSVSAQLDYTVGSLTVENDCKLGVEGSTAFLSFFGATGSAVQLVTPTIASSVTSTATVISNLNTLITNLKTYGLI